LACYEIIHLWDNGSAVNVPKVLYHFIFMSGREYTREKTTCILKFAYLRQWWTEIWMPSLLLCHIINKDAKLAMVVCELE